MSTPYVHDFLSFICCAVTRVAQEDTSTFSATNQSISKHYITVSQAYKSYCSADMQPSCTKPGEDDDTGNLGPYDDDGD